MIPLHAAACALALFGFVGAAVIHSIVHRAYAAAARTSARDAAHVELSRRRAEDAAASAAADPWWRAQPCRGEA